MQNYTLTLLVNEKVPDPARGEIFEAIKKNFGGLIKEDLWGIRSLAYDIKHMNKAFYAHFEFEAEPSSVITLDKHIRLNEDIIRYLIVKIEVKRQKSKGKSTDENSNPIKPDSKVEEAGDQEIKEEEVVIKGKKIKSKK